MLDPVDIAHHAGLGRGDDEQFYMDIIHTPHEVSAVTAAAMMVDVAAFRQVGGFDDEHVPNAYGDVDFCLKLAEAGFATVYTPYARLIHRESESRGTNIELNERAYMKRRWGAQLVAEPYVSPMHERTGQYTWHRVESFPSVPPRVFAQWLRDGRIPGLDRA
jgi:GT2 family glycosyltransferase